MIMRNFLVLIALASPAFVFSNSQSSRNEALELQQEELANCQSELSSFEYSAGKYINQNYHAEWFNSAAENFFNSCVATNRDRVHYKEDILPICSRVLRNYMSAAPDPVSFNEGQIWTAKALGGIRVQMIKSGCPEPYQVPPPVLLKNFNQIIERNLNK